MQINTECLTELIDLNGEPVSSGVEIIDPAIFGDALKEMYYGTCMYVKTDPYIFYHYIGDKKTKLAKELLQKHKDYKGYFNCLVDEDTCELYWAVSTLPHQELFLPVGEPFASAKFRKKCMSYRESQCFFDYRQVLLIVQATNKVSLSNGNEPDKQLICVGESFFRSKLEFLNGKIFSEDKWLSMGEWDQLLKGPVEDYLNSPEFIKLHKEYIRQDSYKRLQALHWRKAMDQKAGEELARLIDSASNRNSLLLELAKHAATALGDIPGYTNETLCPAGEYMDNFSCPYNVPAERHDGRRCGHDYRMCFFHAIANNMPRSGT